MLTAIANVHRHKLPRPGAIVRLSERIQTFRPHCNRWIVESYPLSDAADQRYSCGIHTVVVRTLDGKYRRRVSGFWCEEV